MAGYMEDYSMSKNAALAYKEGLAPASKVVKGIPAHLVEKFVDPSEWHHSSKMYNKVNFFDPHHVKVVFGMENHSPENCDNSRTCEGVVTKPAAIEALKNPKEVWDAVHTGQDVEWTDWVGKGRNQKPVKKSAKNAEVKVRGEWSHITLEDGTKFKKKSYNISHRTPRTEHFDTGSQEGR